ncbi:hypothetical protein [Pseudomonas syringae]|nr:hypothetical protein [Pseudomonas syringae]
MKKPTHQLASILENVVFDDEPYWLQNTHHNEAPLEKEFSDCP